MFFIYVCTYDCFMCIYCNLQVFNVSNCGKLKSFVSSATLVTSVSLPTRFPVLNATLSLLSSSLSSTTNYPSSTNTMPSITMAINSSSSANKANSTTTSALLTSHMASTLKMSSMSTTMKSSLSTNKTPSKSITTSPTPHTQAPSSSNGSSKLLYIVIPTAAPVAFIISFITVFSLLNWCHQRGKKKLYIKLTSTIYSEEDDSDNSDD